MKQENFLDDCFERSCEYFSVDLDSSKRDRDTYARPRFMTIYWMHLNSDATLKTTGKQFGDRDHSTIIHALGQHALLMEKSLDYHRDFTRFDHVMTTQFQQMVATRINTTQNSMNNYRRVRALISEAYKLLNQISD